MSHRRIPCETGTTARAQDLQLTGERLLVLVWVAVVDVVVVAHKAAC